MTIAGTHEPRKRPIQARSAQVVEALVEAAARILEAQGVGGLTTNAVAARAGVSIGSLYQYFPGKGAIIAALIRRETAAFERVLDAALDRASGLPLAIAVKALSEAVVAHKSVRPRLGRLLDREESALGLADEAASADAGVQVRLAAFLALHHAAGPAGDVHEAAWDVLHLSRALIDAAFERRAIDDLPRRVAGAILGYLAVPTCP